MLSRRNVRIKVMQVLYSLNRGEQVKADAGVRAYRDLVDRSFQLYIYNLLVVLRTAEYARQDAARRQSKLLPSDEDKAFTAKLADNNATQSIAKNAGLVTLFGRNSVRYKIDADQIRLLYIEFSKKEEYRNYVFNDETTGEDDRRMLLSLYRYLIGEELFEGMVEDQFPLWSDDKSLVVGAMKKTLKSLPVSEDFYEEFRPDRDTVTVFGETLLRYVLDSDAELLQVIEPVLNNWDAERVAIIDMILLKMAIAEFTQFSSIPTKVTLNEYVEISKQYSTDKSKDFINGILDRLLKNLQENGMINKQGRGLQD